MNRLIRTVIVAPMSAKGMNYPSRIACGFQGKQGQVVLDQIRTVDKARLVRKLGRIAKPAQERVLSVLSEMFAA